MLWGHDQGQGLQDNYSHQMALAYFALKHMKRNRRIRQKQIETEQLELIAPAKKLEKLDNFSSNHESVCRICLNTGSIPIYGLSNGSTIAKSIQMFGEINLDADDDFPKHICGNCHNLLQSAIRFRKSAKYSDQLLRHKQIVSENDNFRVDDDDHGLLENNDFTEDNKTNEIPTPMMPYSCKLCKLNFETNDEFTLHIKLKQHKKVRIQCNICQRLITANLYKRHVARHNSASHLICEVCGKLFRKDNLIRHLQLHSYKLPYQCQICPYRGRYVDSLKIHMRTHTGDKPFSCDKCELRFLTRSNLNRHLLTHKKERPFRCHECGRGFYVKRDLEVHFKSDHVGIKEFGCCMCGNKYGTRKALMRHELRVHKRDKMGKGRVPLYLQEEYQASSHTHEPEETAL